MSLGVKHKGDDEKKIIAEIIARFSGEASYREMQLKVLNEVGPEAAALVGTLHFQAEWFAHD